MTRAAFKIFRWRAVGVILLAFVALVIVILIMVAGGTKVSAVSSWKEEKKGAMRLMVGVLLAALGWILILIANGTINFA